MRLLATHHIFREVLPNVFANNRCSSTLDTGKSVAELRAEYATLCFNHGCSPHGRIFKPEGEAFWNEWLCSGDRT